MKTVQKTSKKREAIYEALHASKEHPTAEMLYSELKEKIPELSLGTVYRNLTGFVERGEAITVGNVGGNERYDARTEPHLHFICRDCRRVIDIELPDTTDDLYSKIEDGTGFKVDTHALSFYGQCGDCRHDK